MENIWYKVDTGFTKTTVSKYTFTEALFYFFKLPVCAKIIEMNGNNPDGTVIVEK